jgi:uncharacterized protein
MTAAQHWRDSIGEALLTARKDRDATRVSSLRCALSAIDNAGAVDASQEYAVVGFGAAEVARRELSDAQIRALIRAEVDERLAAAGAVEATHTQRATALRLEADVLSGLLGDV